MQKCLLTGETGKDCPTIVIPTLKEGLVLYGFVLKPKFLEKQQCGFSRHTMHAI
jgi:hypothetical protein